MNTHTTLPKVNKFHQFRLSYLSREKLVKKFLLKDLQSHRHTSKRSFVSPLRIPSLVHILELVYGQLDILTFLRPYIINYLVYHINKFWGVFINLRSLEGRTIHQSEVPIPIKG